MTKRYFDEEGNEVFLTTKEDEITPREQSGLETFEETTKSCGSALSGCGCLLTLLVTIPILILLVLLF